LKCRVESINKHNCLNHSIGSAYAVICGEQSNLTVVDFDVKEEYHRLMEIHPELKERWTIQTNKGFHIWFKYDSDFKTTTNGFSDYEGVDIRNGGGVVFCAPTTYKYPNGDIKQYVDLGGIFELPPAYLKTYLKQRRCPSEPLARERVPSVNQKVPEPVGQGNKSNEAGHGDAIPVIDKLLYLGLLDGQAFGTWDDWRNVGLCMRWITTFEHFETFSKINTSKYDKKETIELWNSIHEKYEAMNLGTLFSYAKEYNKDKYNLYFNYFIPLNKMTKGALTIAECISPKLERHLKWSNDKWFMFYKKTNLWMETKEPSHIIVQMIHKHIDYSIQIKINERTKTRNEDGCGNAVPTDEKQKSITDEITKYSKMYGEVDKSGFYAMITKHLKTILYDSEFFYKLDNNPYKIAFQDGIYDMRENKFKKDIATTISLRNDSIRLFNAYDTHGFVKMYL